MRPGHAGRASSSRVYRISTSLTTTWLRLYTRSVDPRYAAERVSEVEFELWEHALVADQRWSPAHAAMSLAFRTTAGAPRDLSWRHAARFEPSRVALSPVHLLGRRSRQRFWVPLQAGHVFDQTNWMIEPEKAMPYERPNDSFGAAGNAFGLQGGF
jgi:hypothetical protein